MNKFFIVLIGALVALTAFTACGGVPFVAQDNATETPTRRAPRPTFTPKPRATETAEVEPTDEPEQTDEPEPTEESEPTDIPVPVTNTPRPTARPQQAQPTQPPPPVEPPPPQFSMNITDNFLCQQEGIYEIVVNVKQNRAMVEGIYFAAFDAGGRLLQDGAGNNLVTATYPVSISTAGNCKLSGSFENPVLNNGKLDIGDAVRAGTTNVFVRFIKSENDLTPISPNIPIDFSSAGRFWIYAQSQ